MSRKVLLIAMVSTCLWVTTASDARAQRPNRSISRPTLSPYLNMFRHDVGYTDPYNALVRPYLQQNQQRTRRDIRAPMGAAGNPVQASELLRARALSQQQQAVGIAPTGTNSVFNNLGHFYPVHPVRNYRR